MDAECTVGKTVSELRENMNLYATKPGKWRAPYTSLVTSSMMGKSRHMKEVANYLPSVYICLRGEARGYGYPRRSPSIVEWSARGATALFKKAPIDHQFWFSTLRWSAFILETIRQLAKWIDDGRFFTSLGIDPSVNKRLEFAWLWNFFAEPPVPVDGKPPWDLERFWYTVQKKTYRMLENHPSGLDAHTYFHKHHATDVRNAMDQLRQCFAKYGHNDDSLPLLFIYDEARVLCDHDAYNGARIYEEHAIDLPPGTNEDAEGDGMPLRSFSNFRAIRRALRYLPGATTDVPRVFAVFTDTTSRITNFQPTSWNDPSLRVPRLPQPGPGQFRPIFVFSSVDVYSRVLNDPNCISSPEAVADPERLLKFGRAGWYSAYVQRNISRTAQSRDSRSMIKLATAKLLSSSDARPRPEEDPFDALSQAHLIKLIATLAPRLALTIGPYTLEASELIASHLAVLTRTDERHFLRTVYPSEPILAEASAQLTHTNGWANPLKALVHYVRGGIVEAGFKGELITKIVCLMAMDRALSQIQVAKNRWRFSRPIPVSDFLNHLVVPLRGYSTFSEGLRGVRDRDNILRDTLNIDDEKLRTFLRGYVFFNHFIRIDVKLSYSMLVHAWNRGAAIMCMTNTKGIDHVIPVMLETKGDVTFGPLHGPWQKEEIQQARQHLSYILINSKNYASGKDQIHAAWATRFSEMNLEGYGDSFQSAEAAESSDEMESRNDGEDLDTDSQYISHDDELNVASGTDVEMTDAEMHESEMDNVFLSLVQDFGKKRPKEPWVAVGKALKAYTRPRSVQPLLKQAPLDTQFIVILKGIGTDTYKCLENLNEPDDSPSNQIQDSVRRYLKELTSARVDYVDKKEKWKRAEGMQNIPLVYGDSMLGSANWEKYRPDLQRDWQTEMEAYGWAVESRQSQTDVAQDVNMDEGN
jgi:hypothetical protein